MIVKNVQMVDNRVIAEVDDYPNMIGGCICNAIDYVKQHSEIDQCFFVFNGMVKAVVDKDSDEDLVLRDWLIASEKYDKNTMQVITIGPKYREEISEEDEKLLPNCGHIVFEVGNRR